MTREKIQELKSIIQELKDDIRARTEQKKKKEMELVATQGRLEWNSNMLWSKPKEIDKTAFENAIAGNKERISLLSEQIAKLDQQLKEANKELEDLSKKALPMAEALVTVFEDVQTKLEQQKNDTAPLIWRGLKK